MFRVAAVDLGATSARVAVVDLDATPPHVDVVHRVAHGPVRDSQGSLRWDWSRLLDAVDAGLGAALDGGPLASIGVDTWGVDYGLLDDAGALVAAPFSYRDERTAGWEAVVDRIGRDHLYRTTGIQLMGLNTIFQLAVHDRGELARSRRLLMLPELVAHHLCGVEAAEVTSAGTTGLVDVGTGDWSTELLGAIDVDPGLFLRPERSGRCLGLWRGVPVHLVGGHDTASAALASPAPLFVSAGTWCLVGAERPAPDVSDAARQANFSNEPGVFGGVRFLKNVTGLWLLEQCRDAWGEPPVAQLLAEAAAAPASGPVFDTEAVTSEADIRDATGLSDRGRIVRSIIESIAAATSRVVAELKTFLPEVPSEIGIVGGGAAMGLLTGAIADATGLAVSIGSTEATVLGNARAQGVALGR